MPCYTCSTWLFDCPSIEMVILQHESSTASHLWMARLGKLGSKKHRGASISTTCLVLSHVRYKCIYQEHPNVLLIFPSKFHLFSSAERMHQLAERLSPVSASLVNSRGISTSAVRRSDEEKVGAAFEFFTDFVTISI